MKSLTFARPNDLHVHFRDGAILREIVPFTARAFGKAIVMPNLTPPVTQAAQASAYRQRILAAVPAGVEFTPLMTCYLTDDTDAADLRAGHHDGIFTAAKLYPAHATTNAHYGVTSIERIYDVIAVMEEHEIPLLTHGELTRPDVDIFDREKGFIDEVLVPLLARFPRLRVVLEHITTQEGVQAAASFGARLGATITPQHLLFNRNALFQGGLRPHMYCLPILKREKHRLALRKAATSGDTHYFLGTDTAPHLQHLKEMDCGCAGVFSAPTAVEAYLQVFEEEGALEQFERFAALNGAAFYGFAPATEKVTYIRQPRRVAEAVFVGELGALVPLFAGTSVGWSLASPQPPE